MAKLPAKKAKYVVTFAVDLNGILTATAKDETNGVTQSITIKNLDKYTKEEKESMKNHVQRLYLESNHTSTCAVATVTSAGDSDGAGGGSDGAGGGYDDATATETEKSPESENAGVSAAATSITSPVFIIPKRQFRSAATAIVAPETPTEADVTATETKKSPKTEDTGTAAASKRQLRSTAATGSIDSAALKKQKL